MPQKFTCKVQIKSKNFQQAQKKAPPVLGLSVILLLFSSFGCVPKQNGRSATVKEVTTASIKIKTVPNEAIWGFTWTSKDRFGTLQGDLSPVSDDAWKT